MVQWATFVFWNFLNPVLHAHHRYYRTKVVLDRILEKRGATAGLFLGILVGSTAYYGIVAPLLLPPSAASLALADGTSGGTSRSEVFNDLMRLMGPVSASSSASSASSWLGSAESRTTMAAGMDIPALALMRLRGEMMSRIHVALDKSEVRRQREEVAHLKRLLLEPHQQPPLAATVVRSS